MMALPAQTYISGFSIPQHFEDEAKKLFIRKWIMSHSQDHTNMFSLLNNLEKAAGLPLLELNQYALFFDPENLDSTNKFLSENTFQHEEFGGWVNQLGANLASLGKTPVVFYTLLNPMVKMIRLSFDDYNKFFYAEQRVHTLSLSAINALFAAYES